MKNRLSHTAQILNCIQDINSWTWDSTNINNKNHHQIAAKQETLIHQSIKHKQPFPLIDHLAMATLDPKFMQLREYQFVYQTKTTIKASKTNNAHEYLFTGQIY